jgi:hypothetical protein
MQRWLTAIAAAIVTAIVVGLPTEMVASPWFHRMTPVRWWDRPVWLVTAVLAGLLVATFVAGGTAGDERTARRGGAGGVLAVFAVGCPVCNKLVVLALGTTGAHAWFEPVQPLLALVAVALLAMALRARLRGEQRCEVTFETVDAGPPTGGH